MLHHASKIQHVAPANMTLGEARKFRLLVRVHRLTPTDATRVIENERRRTALLYSEVTDTFNEQARRRTTVGVAL